MSLPDTPIGGSQAVLLHEDVLLEGEAIRAKTGVRLGIDAALRIGTA